MEESRRQFLRNGAALGALGLLALREDALQRVEAAVTSAGTRSPQELAADEDFWLAIQQAYAIDRSLINLNNGGVSPSPRVVRDAMRRHLEFSNNAPARHLWQVLDPQVETVRSRLARAFGCNPEEMAITRNASESLEICIYGFDLRAGDEVLTTELDYPRMINTFKQRELREGIALKSCPIEVPVNDAGDIVAAFEKAITPKTKLMLCCHVIFLTGQVFPVREICRLGRRHGIPVVVDGAHAFAHLDFKRDDLECDYYATSLHKWLCAPHGTGFLYVQKDRIEPLWPLMAAVEPKSGNIRKFEEIGTHPVANSLAIAEALTLHNAIGPARKEARFRYLRNRWAHRLMQDSRVKLFTRLEPEHGAGIATMGITGIDTAKLHSHLWAEHHIITTTIKQNGIDGIRVTPNVYTTLEEIDMFCAAVEQVLANGLPA